MRQNLQVVELQEWKWWKRLRIKLDGGCKKGGQGVTYRLTFCIHHPTLLHVFYLFFSLLHFFNPTLLHGFYSLLFTFAFFQSNFIACFLFIFFTFAFFLIFFCSPQPKRSPLVLLCNAWRWRIPEI